MEPFGAVVKVFLLLGFSVHLSSADTHSLQYLYTGVTPGISFPEFTAVGLVDGELSLYYDSDIKNIIPKTEWIKKVFADHRDYWDREEQIWLDEQEWLKNDVATAMKRFNQSKGVHTVQLMFGCELNDDDGSTRAYSHFGYDGEDFISLDLKTKTWTAANVKAVILENKWNPTGHKADYCTFYLKTECIYWLKKFVSYGRETLERKVPPTASVYQKHSPPEVVCHATGFFPKTVMITWKKDEEDVHEDVDLRETLPNQDGSFQKRSILTVPAEDLQKHTYTCVIQHSSLEKEIVLHEKDIRILKPDGGSGRKQIRIIAVVVALVALVVIVGTVVWKNNNFGFSSVPPTSTS